MENKYSSINNLWINQKTHSNEDNLMNELITNYMQNIYLETNILLNFS